MRVWALFPSCIVVTSHSGNCQIELRLAQKHKKKARHDVLMVRVPEPRGALFFPHPSTSTTPLQTHGFLCCQPHQCGVFRLAGAMPVRCCRCFSCGWSGAGCFWFQFLGGLARARARGKKARTSAPQQRTVRVLSCLSFPLSLCVFFG